MTHLRIDVNREEYYTAEPNPRDSWDNGCSAASIEINGMYVMHDSQYRDITVDFDVVRGRNYYLLWADYCTGDSFGTYDNCFEAIDVFETWEAADAARQALLNTEGRYNGCYTRENGKQVSMSLPWVGYFEHLNDLNIQKVRAI